MPSYVWDEIDWLFDIFFNKYIIISYMNMVARQNKKYMLPLLHMKYAI